MKLFSKFVHGLAAAGLAAFLVGSATGNNAAAAPGDNVTALLNRTAQGEQVRVIVGLQLPSAFRAEGLLRSRAAVTGQRRAIAASRAEVIDDLFGLNAQAYASWDSLPFVALEVGAAALERLAFSPLVSSIQEDVADEPHLASAMAHVGADLTVASGFGGMGKTVVILDTGIDANHPFYSGRVVAQACWSNTGDQSLCPDGSGNQIGPGAAEVTDGTGAPTAACADGGSNICDHGSHVAGIAAGEDPPSNPQLFNGVAPDANIIAIQVFSRFNAAGDCNPNPAPCVKSAVSDQISALDHINNTLSGSWDIASANMSLGGGMNTSACDGDGRKMAIDNLRSKDIATVISSGNQDWTDALGAPGCISTAVTVGNVFDPSDNVTDNMHDVVDILAAGRQVVSSVPDDNFGTKSGTSMAAPQVTGAFAVIGSIDPSLSVGEIEQLLEDTGVLVTDTRAPNPAGSVTGHVKPRLQLALAVASLLPADLRVLKECKPDAPLMAGDTATCTILVDNLGPAQALDVMVVDEHVSNGTFEIGTVTTTAGSCSATPNPQNGAGTVTCDLDDMAADDRVTIKVSLTADDTQDINDIVTVSHDNPLADPNLDNNVDFDHVGVMAVADLGITKSSSPDPVVAGEALTYTVAVSNNGPSAAVNVLISDILPAGVSIDSVSATGGGMCNAGEPGDPTQPTTCAFDSLADGDSETMTIDVTVLPEAIGILINDASVSADTVDKNNANDLATETTTVNTEADLVVDKSDSPDPVLAGDPLTYVITVTNNGPSVARDVKVTDSLPADVAFDSAVADNGGPCVEVQPGVVECTLGDLAVGETVTVFIDVTVDPSVPDGTTITNNVTVTSSTDDPNLANNDVSENTTVNAEADLWMEKTGGLLSTTGSTGNSSGTLQYFLTVHNDAGCTVDANCGDGGPSDAQNVVVVDTLPEDPKKIRVEFISPECQYNGAAHTVTCTTPVLAAGETVTYEIQASPKGRLNAIFNTAVVSSDTTDPDGGNNSHTLETVVKGGTGNSGGPN